MHVALLLGQESKEVVSTVLQCGANMGLFLLWGLDIYVSEMCDICVLCLLVAMSLYTYVVCLHMLP